MRRPRCQVKKYTEQSLVDIRLTPTLRFRSSYSFARTKSLRDIFNSGFVDSPKPFRVITEFVFITLVIEK